VVKRTKISFKEKSRRKLHGMKKKVTMEVPFQRKRNPIEEKRKKTQMLKNNLELTLADINIMKNMMLIKSQRKP